MIASVSVIGGPTLAMDELVHHCLREISFDGDLGCDVHRLRGFVTDFYNFSAHKQTVDDGYFAFVWSLLVQEPSVRIGTVPLNSSTEVYVAPQASRKREKEDADEPSIPGKLEIIPESKTRTWIDLWQHHGDTLRIAVDPETTFAALTGSHIRPTKLTPMVYTILQLITRGRDNGVSVIDLNKKTNYGSKACFYLVKQLLDLDLIVKLRQGGVGSNFCVHKYFFDRNPLWQQIRDEENHANEDDPVGRDGDEDDEDSTLEMSATGVRFDPIDSRHLSSLSLIRTRVVKLLKHANGHLQPNQNLLPMIGFVNPTKTDRRFFQTRLRQLEQEGVIERVTMPHPSPRKSSSTSTIVCIRLVHPETQIDPDEDADAGFVEDGLYSPRRCSRAEPDFPSPTDHDAVGLKVTVTIHKQMTDLLEKAGTTGMTLNELSTALSNFDRRTLELLLSRLDKYPPPSHLADLRIAQLMETHGKERRYRYFTLASYQAIVDREKLDDSNGPYAGISLDNVGGFAPIAADDFYDDCAALEEYVDNLKEVSTKPKGRPASSKKKTGDSSGTSQREKKRKRKDLESENDNEADEVVEPPQKKKRGRPPKVQLVDVSMDMDGSGPPSTSDMGPPPVPRKRGRPRKHPVLEDIDMVVGSNPPEKGTHEVSPPTSAKKRGRPRKQPLSESLVPTEASPADTLPPSSSSTVLKKRGRAQKDRLSGDSRASGNPDPAEQLFAKASALSEGASTPPPVTKKSERRPLKKPRVGTRDDGLTTEGPVFGIQDQSGEGAVSNDLISTEPPSSTGPDEQVTEGSPSISGPRRSSRKPKANLRDNSWWENEQSSLTRGLARHRVEVHGMDTMLDTNLPVAGQRESSVPLESVVSSNSGAEFSLPLQVEDIPIDPSLLSDMPDPQSSTRIESGDKGKGGRTKGNVSQLRRENEVLKVLAESFQGIANVGTKEFFDAHLALLGSMAAAGEPTSGLPGVRVDKRTVNVTFDSLESRGKVKILRTSILTGTGTQRHVRIAYLPSIDDTRLQAFLSDLPSTVIRDLPVPAGSPDVAKLMIVRRAPSSTNGSAQPRPPDLPLELLQLDKSSKEANVGKAERLFQHNDTIIRDVLLSERSTLAQLYGFIPGKALRARELHIATLAAFEKEVDTVYVVSSEQRIINTAFYTHDLPVSIYFAVVSALVHEDELGRILSDPDTKATSLKDLPANLHASLQIGRSRSRARLLDLLEVLSDLRLVTPLQPSTSENSPIKCFPNGVHPVSFEPSTQEWSSVNQRNVPVYWQFNKDAPLHFWVLSETSPPLWKTQTIRSSEEAKTYWKSLQIACESRSFAEQASLSDTPISSVDIDIPRLSRCLRRTASWSSGYDFTFHQRQYLRKYIDRATGATPLQDEENGQEALQRLSAIVSAPVSVLKEFFTKTRTKQFRDLDRVKDRERERAAKQSASSDKAKLAQRAEDTLVQRESQWLDMLRRIHPGELQGTHANRVGRVHTRFLHGSNSDREKWEGEISRAIQEANMATEAALSTGPRPGASLNLPDLPSVTSAGKTVEQLIKEQGPARPLPRPKKKKSKKGKEREESEDQPSESSKKRHRFLWNRDFDELAMDASVIVRARCKDTRVDLSALDQVFPAVPRNSVRQRYLALREHPGAEAYLKRLEDRWNTLWIQHRGTDRLPDPDPTSTTNFDLRKHIEFLRQHIDKNALRVGFTEAHASVNIPADVSQLESLWNVVDKPAVAPTWDLMWSLHVEEAREKALLQSAFILDPEEMPHSYDASSDANVVVESTLKMVFGTPNERYDSDVAANLLHNFSEEAISNAQSSLLQRGVLAKLVRDPLKSRPGRTLKISEMNQNQLGGSINRDVFQDASTLEALYKEADDTWKGWPLLCSDGDIAMLIQATSAGRLEFKVDTSNAQAARLVLDWNSKKADDDQIETQILLRPVHLVDDVEESPMAPEMTEVPTHPSHGSAQHGQTLSGSAACCRTTSDGIVDCCGCLSGEQHIVVTQSTEPAKILYVSIVDSIQSAGEDGLRKAELVELLPDHDRADVISALGQLVESSTPLLLCVGYSPMILVSAHYADRWTIPVSDNPVTKVLPRRWLDIGGRQVPEMWEAALRAVMGTIVFRPGISQA
ncbi:hypothetical protein OF83DRAFT_1213502 [Amylostereum chailletii]|nr:hypothetical protein OF83DRAFT_1213502 [Amylostereum chailletii]